MADKKNFKQWFIDYIKNNKLLILLPIIALGGYVLFFIFLMIDNELKQVEYLPALPMFTSLAINLFSILFLYDSVSTYITMKNKNRPYIFLSVKSDNDDPSVYINPSLMPLFSVFFRLFIYTGIYLLIILTFGWYFKLNVYGERSFTLLISGIMFSLLYETFRAFSYVLVKLVSKILSEKIMKRILWTVTGLVALFFLIVFVIRLVNTQDILAGLSELANNPFWDYFMLSRWTFDIIHIGLGYDLQYTILSIIISFVCIEIILHLILLFTYKNPVFTLDKAKEELNEN